jgi:hypothetical protein
MNYNSVVMLSLHMGFLDLRGMHMEYALRKYLDGLTKKKYGNEVITVSTKQTNINIWEYM